MKKILFLLAAFLPFVSQAQILRLSLIADPAPAQIKITGSYSAFTTTAGTSSTSQSVTVQGIILTANVVFTLPGGSGMEISSDNATWGQTVTFTQSGGTANGTLWARIAGGTAAGNYSGNIVGTTTGALNANVPFSATVNTPSTITVTGSMSNFTTTTGTASAAQTVTVSGTNLTANVVATWPSGFEGSLDNVTYASTRTLNQSGGTLTGQPVTVYTRVAASASAGSYSSNVTFTSTGATTQNVAVTATVNALLSAIFNFSSSASAASGATNFFGDPTASPSFTDAGTGWTLAAVGANWTKFGGFFGGVNNGARQASSDGTFTQAQISSNMFTNSSFTAGVYNLQFTNLPAGTYSITILGSVPDSIFDNGGGNAAIGYSEYHLRFGPSGSDNVAIYNPNNNPVNNIGNLVSNGPGTTQVTTGSFNGTITTGQLIYINVSKGNSCCTGANGQIGWINALKITKIN